MLVVSKLSCTKTKLALKGNIQIMLEFITLLETVLGNGIITLSKFVMYFVVLLCQSQGRISQ